VRSALVVLCLILASPATGFAQPESAARGPWDDAFDPTRRDAERLVRQGLLLLLLAEEQLGGRASPLAQAPYSQIDSALVRFERARQSMPDDPDLAFYTATALSSWERPGRDGGTEYRAEDAIAAWHRLRALDPDYMPARVALALAQLHFRRLELRRAAAEYEISLDRSLPEATILMGRTYLPSPLERRLALMYFEVDGAMVHGNLAEARMQLGELEAAVQHYQAAIVGSETPMSSALAGWGLALALHRGEDRERSLHAASDAIDLDPLAARPERDRVQRRWGAFAVLHDPAVFFEPAYEMFGYHAVGYEAFAARPGVDTRAALTNALASWRRFLAEGGTSSRFAAHARAQVERLESEVDSLPDDDAPARPSAPDLRLLGSRPASRALRDASARTWLPL